MAWGRGFTLTQDTGAYSRDSGRNPATQPSATGAARQEAANVGQSVRDAGGHVAHGATEQTRQVVSETRRQARDLLGEVREQAREQASAQQHKAAQGLRTLADEMREMAANGGQSGTATEFTQQASERIGRVAQWIEQREPGDLLGEVREFARRRPSAFLFGAAVAGVMAGRFTKGVTAAAGSGDQQQVPAVRPDGGVTPPPGTSAMAEPAGAQPATGHGPSGVSGTASGGVSGRPTTGRYPAYEQGQP